MTVDADKDYTTHLPGSQRQSQGSPIPLTMKGKGEKHANLANRVQGSGTMNNGQINGHIDDHRKYKYTIVNNIELNIPERSSGLPSQGQAARAQAEGFRSPEPDYGAALSNSLPVTEPEADGETVAAENDKQDDRSQEQDARSFENSYAEAKPMLQEFKKSENSLQKTRQHLMAIGSVQDPRVLDKARRLGMLLRKIKRGYREIKREFRKVSVVCYSTEDPFEITQLFEKTVRVRLQSQEMELRAQPVPQMMGVEELNLQLTRCRDCAQVVNDSLASFRSLFDKFCFQDPHDSLDPYLLKALRVSRDASGDLCHHLSQLCPSHPAHQVYFGLGREQQVVSQCDVTKFIFACQDIETPQREDSLAWVRTQSSTRSLALRFQAVSQTAYPTTSVSGARFCPARLPHNFVFELGGIQLNCLDSQDVEQRNPIRLSKWLNKYQDRHTKIRVARMMAEAVLNLDPNLWHPTCLETTKVFIVSVKYKQTESHISIRLERPINNAGVYGSTAPTIQEVLFGLGLTLLQLEYCQEIPRPERRDLTVRLSGKRARDVYLQCYHESLAKEMGIGYAEVTQFCLFKSHYQGNMYDLGMQGAFYRNVIQPLEVEERNSGGIIETQLQEVAKDVLSTSG